MANPLKISWNELLEKFKNLSFSVNDSPIISKHTLLNKGNKIAFSYVSEEGLLYDYVIDYWSSLDGLEEETDSRNNPFLPIIRTNKRECIIVCDDVGNKLTLSFYY